MTISAVLIVKNEEVLLAQCLESVKGLDQIVIADTGSTDNTINIARKYTNLIFCNYKWNDDFAEARNYAKSKARTDWILSIDADEKLYDVGAVREAVALAEARQGKAVDVKCITDPAKGKWFFYPRLFKNVPEVFWESPIHNTLSVFPEKVGNVRLFIGNSPAHNNDPERAFRILKKDVETRFHPRSMYYLGREYWYRKDYENAVIMLGKYVQVSTFLSEKADAFLIMARCYWMMKMANDARDACAQALIINARFKEAILFMAELSWEDNAKQWKHMAETANNEDVLFIREP
jgi:glycosyltransferase involved in cell wall biosynthesis